MHSEIIADSLVVQTLSQEATSSTSHFFMQEGKRGCGVVSNLGHMWKF